MSIQNEFVILVDNNDSPLGVMEKQEAHIKNKKHRAFSVFLIDENGALILQKRAKDKYHSPNLWTNACCGHPRPNENTIDAAKRRTFEELNIEVELDELFTLSYEERLENNLWENEYDHVFIGKYIGEINNFNPEEVSKIKHITPYELMRDLNLNAKNYTFWFKKILPTLIPLLEKVD